MKKSLDLNLKANLETNNLFDMGCLIFRSLTNYFEENDFQSNRKDEIFSNNCNYHKEELMKEELSGVEYKNEVSMEIIKYNCIFENCDKVFLEKIGLQNHYKTHYGTNKEYKCHLDFCEKIYKSKENLNLHIKKYSYECKTLSM